MPAYAGAADTSGRDEVLARPAPKFVRKGPGVGSRYRLGGLYNSTDRTAAPMSPPTISTDPFGSSTAV
jgi:hypothetical protein